MSTSHAETADQDRLSESEYRDRLRELPPSAKLVSKVLEGDSPLSQGQLAEAGAIPEVVAERVNASVDTIKQHYDVASERERMEQRRRHYVEQLEL